MRMQMAGLNKYFNKDNALGVACSVTIFLFLSLLLLVTTHTAFINTLDLSVFTFFENIRSDMGVNIMSVVTFLGQKYFIAGMIILLTLGLAWRRQWRASIFMAIFGVFTFTIVDFVKAWAEIPRPPGLLERMSYSFPSGHTGFSAALLTYLIIFFAPYLTPAQKKFLIFSSVLVVLSVAFSRLYLGVHWYSDVLGGILLGVSCGLLIACFYRKAKSIQFPQNSSDYSENPQKVMLGKAINDD